MNVLVVCSMNLGRSQALAHFLMEEAKKLGRKDLHVASAGVNVEGIKRLHEQGLDTYPTTDKMVRAKENLEKGRSLRETGYAKPATEKIVRWADLIIAVDTRVKDKLVELFPRSRGKIELAKEMAAGKTLPKKAGFKDPYSHENPKRYRRGAMQASSKQPSPKAFWWMTREAGNIAKKIVRRI